MTYPVYRFIQEDLKMTVYRFAEESLINQRTLSSWKQRDRSISSLPIQLIDELAYISGFSISDIRSKLFVYELEDFGSKILPFEAAKHMIDEEKNTKYNQFTEAGEKFGRNLKQNGPKAKESIKKLNRYNPKTKDAPLDEFLEQYLRICSAYQIPAFSEFTTISNDEEKYGLINQFLIAAWNTTFDEKEG